MKLSGQANRWLNVVWVCALASIGLACWASSAAEFGVESVGGRYGFPVSPTAAGFREAEGFANWQLPWGWELGKTWHVQSRLDTSLGWLADARANAVVGTVGPTLVLGWRQLPVTLEGGVSPTLLSKYHFPTKNLGYPFQFTSHVGLNWDFAPHFRASYRFQHMSNAGLSTDNPGLNMHLFGVSFVF